MHHIVWRSRGGLHEMENLTTLCGGHHGALHRGEIVITGKAPAIVVTRNFEVSHVGALNPFASDAVLALTTLGFSKREAREAVEGAREAASLEELIRGALRRCPRPLTG